MRYRSLAAVTVLSTVALLIINLTGCGPCYRTESTTVRAQDWPNPFCPTTQITFDLPEPACVTLTIYNVLGQPVRVLIDEEMAAGEHSIEWDVMDDDGNEVASGVYFWKLQTENFTKTKKLMLLR